MAASTTPGLTPSEVAFLAEHELVEVIPRQRLESIQLLGGPTPALIPPRSAAVPLWLALLLKRQQRANINAPAWLRVDALTRILELENELGPERGFTRSVASPATSGLGSDVPVSAPFIPYSSLSTTEGQATAARANGENINNAARNDDDNDDDDPSTTMALAAPLPYHWLEIATLLLGGAADDVPDADAVRRLVRDVREARAAKMREAVLPSLDGGREARLTGVGALEVAEHRLFVTGVLDGLRKIGASKETSRREREEEEERAGGGGGGRGASRGALGAAGGADDSDEDMGL